ncbi:hypothetical protein BCR34DRAFT_326825 [Clohesyomyces aquaticus]|uniref:Uncharacterized protein n=1 Tax=Clohesyomyces aquaticus TaxID=1231657 RepID=A0A1Y1ZMJ1_9PLEO|nr:hypothetical protein BCR34DRAFT_326825 [Clohesyomyces aquaticus]
MISLSSRSRNLVASFYLVVHILSQKRKKRTKCGIESTRARHATHILTPVQSSQSRQKPGHNPMKPSPALLNRRAPTPTCSINGTSPFRIYPNPPAFSHSKSRAKQPRLQNPTSAVLPQSPDPGRCMVSRSSLGAGICGSGIVPMKRRGAAQGCDGVGVRNEGGIYAGWGINGGLMGGVWSWCYQVGRKGGVWKSAEGWLAGKVPVRVLSCSCRCWCLSDYSVEVRTVGVGGDISAVAHLRG